MFLRAPPARPLFCPQTCLNLSSCPLWLSVISSRRGSPSLYLQRMVLRVHPQAPTGTKLNLSLNLPLPSRRRAPPEGCRSIKGLYLLPLCHQRAGLFPPATPRPPPLAQPFFSSWPHSISLSQISVPFLSSSPYPHILLPPAPSQIGPPHCLLPAAVASTFNGVALPRWINSSLLTREYKVLCVVFFFFFGCWGL